MKKQFLKFAICCFAICISCGQLFAQVPLADFKVSSSTVYQTTAAGVVTKSVDFYDLSTNTPTSWAWNFGSGAVPATSTVQNPSCVYYTTTGAKTITLTATNGSGSDVEIKTGYFTVTSPSPQGHRNDREIEPSVFSNNVSSVNNIPVNTYGSYFIDMDNGWVVGYKGLIRKTANGSASNLNNTTWTCQYAGTDADLFAAFAIDINTCYAAGASGTILKTIDGGSTWNALPSGTTYPLWGLWFTSSTTGYAVGGAGTLLKTINSGASWIAQTSTVTNDLHSICFSDVLTGYACGSGGKIIKTTDAINWSLLTSGTTNILYSIDFPASSPNGYAAGTQGTLLRTGNSGSTWTAVGNTAGSKTIYSVQCLEETINACLYVTNTFVAVGDNYWEHNYNRSGCGGTGGGSGAPSPIYYTSYSPPGSGYVGWIGTEGGIPKILPVELISFTAACKSENIILNWTTASEINNDYFAVERSNDGTLFETIGTVKGAGNSSVIRNYEFNDKEILSSTLYYRLKQTDYDGKYEYSPITSVQLPCKDEGITILPNPSSGIFSVTGIPSNAELIVYNLLGEKVFTQKLMSEFVTVDLSNKSEGVYFIKLKTQKEIITQKIIIQK